MRWRQVLRLLTSAAAGVALTVFVTLALVWLLHLLPLRGSENANRLGFARGYIFYGPPFHARDAIVTDRIWELPGIGGYARWEYAWGGVTRGFYVHVMLIVIPAGLLSYLHYRPIEMIRRRRRFRRGLCTVCAYDLRATGDRCPECGTPLREIHLLAGDPSLISKRVSAPAAIVALALCALGVAVWVLSFGNLKGDHHGTQQIFVADGELWFGPLDPAAQQVIETSTGWDIGLMSFTRARSASSSWMSFSVELWCLIIPLALPALIRYRAAARIGRNVRSCWGKPHFSLPAAGEGVRCG
jgi:hypothetical protein